VTRLAHHLDLPVSELTFGSPNGRRLVYGCSSALRHVINPDGSSITFSSKSDLTRHWVVAVRLLLDRDWTWDALAPVGFELQRQVDAGAATTVATIVMPRVVNSTAAQNPDRDHTELVIFDGFDPKPTPGVPLAEWQLTYTLVPHFAEPPAQSDPPAAWSLTLPISTPPTQVPRIVSAGFAFSEYQHDERYSSTAERRRMLYLELDAPPLDAGDQYFARVLAHGPDPVLVQSERTTELPSPAEPPLPIDPEVLR
jgi:hypothetical protein